MLSIELNIWIPLVGLCFLLVLIVKVIAEPRGSYSRRIYFLMLLLCAGILAMEMMQAYLDVHADSIRNSAAMNRPVYFLFYLCLIILCSCWTFYSYYWFNGHRPVGRSEAGFMVAPVAGAVLLVLNLFFGNIYRIDEVSGYMRGPMFFAFIISCYLYMLLAISLTAVTAILKDGNKRKQDLLLFLLFFIFPAIGPVLQYLLPAFSLMGVSEVIALQAVYMAVQQRSLTQHAVEMARYQDEYRSYEKTLSDLLSANTETLYFCHLNITENTRNEERVSSPYIRKQLEGVETIDELFTRIAASVVDTEEAQKFRKTFNRSSLLQNFDSQKTQIVQSFHRLTDGGKTHLVKVSLSMLRNPDSGNIEGILYSVDMNRQEKEEKVITAITDREYDYIALIDVSTKKIDYQYSSAYAVTDNGLKMGDYDTEITASLNGQSAPVLFGRVVEALAKQEEFSYFFTLSDTDRGERQKRITYRYLDEKKADILVFINDITEEISQERNRSEMLQSALREAQHASTMKTEFLSNVSHDMRTPLNAVLGYTDLARKSEDPAVMLDYLSKIDRAGRILLSLINDTLDLSKIETGVVTLKEAPISCGEVIRKVVSAIRPAMDEKHINFVIDNSRAVMATINVDALRLQEIFINLLSNAVKFTPENGTVTFVVECIGLERDCVHDRIIVRDNGCGMSREFLPKIFEPFTQERLASTKNVGGSGLGMSIVKKLVDMMGGSISVESELGKGTSVTVLLDLERVDDRLGEEATPDGSGNSFANLEGIRVLAVEDNEMNMEIVRAVLEMKGVKVTCAEDGEIACRLFRESVPGYFRAILMDLRMPVMDGYEAAREIRRMDRKDAQKIPIIAVSADAFDDDIRSCLDAGMNEHISKPVDPKQLYTLLSLYCPAETAK